jgi:PBSX family phage terminase large subunit
MRKPEDEHPAYLYCPSCQAIELTYDPMPHQEAFHATDYRYNDDGSIKLQIIGVFGGYGSSKSRASLEECLIRCLENPGGTGLFCAPTLGQLKKTTMKTFFNEICPPQLIESFNKSDMELKMVNGFVWYFIPTDDEEKLRSINAGIIHMEEASGINRTIYDQLATRMRDPFTANRVMFVCSNPDVGWIRDVLVENESRKDKAHPEHNDYNPAIVTYIWPTHLNKYLPPDFIDNLRKGRPEWWQARYLDGSFKYSEGLVYPKVGDCFTTYAEYFGGKEVPKSWLKGVSMDWGMRNATAIYFHAINPILGEVVTYKEYYVPGKTVPEHAKELKPMIDEISPGTLYAMVADPSTNNKTDPVNGKSVMGLFQEYDIFFQPGNNHMEAGILRVNSYIERGKWKILTDRNPNLARELINYKYPEQTLDDKKNPDEKPIKKDDHGPDSCRYWFMRLPEDPDLLFTLSSYETPTRYKREEDDEDEDWDDYNEDGKDYLSYI